ncbi:hypothetical protein Ancab_021327 [Ancistrocladus abbreviatus]
MGWLVQGEPPQDQGLHTPSPGGSPRQESVAESFSLDNLGAIQKDCQELLETCLIGKVLREIGQCQLRCIWYGLV